ncbi:MAG: hypothetical protein WCA46_17145 [Actinocatenispora sp.]
MATTKNTPQVATGNAVTRLWRSVRVLTAAVAVSALLLVAAVVVGVYYTHDIYRNHEKTAARDAALSAAKVTATHYMSIDSKTAQRDLNRVVDDTTGDLRRDYKASMSQVKTAMVQNKASTKAQLLWAAVTTSDQKSATVLVAMDAVVTNVNFPDGKKSHYRVRVTMAKPGDRWLASKIEFVG